MSDSTQLWHISIPVLEESWMFCCWSLDFISFPIFFFFFFHFCCLIVLVQSQSLSRRTTPFAPRVQVMGPVWRALSLWSLLIHCWLAFFVSILWKMHSLGNGSFEFPFQCSLLRSFFLEKKKNLISQFRWKLLLLIVTQSCHCFQVVHVQLI